MKKRLNVLCSLLLALSMLLPMAVVPVFAEAEYEAPASPAVTYNMNVDWSFKKAEGTTYPLIPALESAKDANGKYFYDPEFAEDDTWKKVSVPHAPNSEEQFMNLGVDAGDSGVWRGFMFYRKNITIPETAASKYFLEFEAFRQSVYLYVNGHIVGYYEAGIAPVGFDITDYVTPGEEALIAVATDNSASRGNDNSTLETRAGSKIPDITLAEGETPVANNGYGYQWNTKDFNEVQGGITGNVNLYAKGSIYQTLPLYNNLKTTGNYIYGSNFDIRGKSADVNVEAEVRNESGEAKDITLEVKVVDKDGIVVGEFSKTEAVAAATDTDAHFVSMVPENAYDENGTGVEHNSVDTSTVQVTKITASANISDLKFWSDVSPNLYDVYTILKDGDTVIDVDKTTTGFREVKYDKDKGLQINGETTYLKGYAQRSTNEWAAIGVANDWLTDIDMQLIKESNANFIRWMHIAPNPVDIRAGDKYGVVSIVPAGDKEGDATGRAWDQRLEAMRDVIIYFRNSPSALFWEAGNNAITPEHMKAMTDLRKELAPSSDTRMGCRTISSKEQIAEAEWAGTMLYRHDADAYASMGATGNYIPLLETEYHRNESPRRVWDDFSPPYYDYVNKFIVNGGKTDGYDVWDQTQEDFSRTMFNGGDGYTYYYNNRVGGSGKNYYSGAAMMVWSDSNMHVRNCGVETCRTSGRVDPIRVKKESFYAIQAAQSAEPAIHILGHWNYPSYIEGDKENGNYWFYDTEQKGDYRFIKNTMSQRNPKKKTVYVIGSDDVSKVELYINDELVATDTTATDNYIYAFDNIDVTQSGTISAKAYNEASSEPVATHEIKTAGAPETIKLTPVYGPDNKLRADGSDLMYVDVEVVDAQGNVCPLDERKITFEVSDPSKATFIGGYNSGYYGNYENGEYNNPGERVVNHKNYVFAECGINRVFVQSTREAGDVTLTASAEGMGDVQITISSEAFETEGGLTTVTQQSYKQGEVPEPPAKATAPTLKSMGDVFTADWTEGTGNVVLVDENAKDWYTVEVNGKAVEFTDRPYKPDSSTGVVGEINAILDAMNAAGADFTYEYKTEGALPSVVPSGGQLPYLTINSGGTVIDVINGATNIVVNGEQNLTNLMVVPNSNGNALIGELGAIIGLMQGVEINTNEASKVVSINIGGYESYAGGLSYADGAVTVGATKRISNANLIFAGYNENGTLAALKVQQISVDANSMSDPIPVPEDIAASHSVKAMLWAPDMSKIKPLADAIDCEDNFSALSLFSYDTAMPSNDISTLADYKVDEVYDYDTVALLQKCDEAVANMVLSDDTSPDGTKYLKNTEYDNDGKGVCFDGLTDNSKADIMWEADVRFDEDKSGITPYDKGDKKLGTCIRRNGTKLAVQTGSSSFKDYCDIDPAKWYHIALVGRFSAPNAVTDMYVYEYTGAEKTLINVYKGVNQRNLSANSNNGAQHWNVHKGTSVDNLKITMLGADTLSVSSAQDAAMVKGGNNLQMSCSATRQGAYIDNPAITWSVYNEANDTPLDETSGVTINENGILNVDLTAASMKVNVRATAGEELYGSKEIEIKSVDPSKVKFDTLTLTADKDYVSATEPLTVNVAASKNGEAVTLDDSDLIWYATDSTDMYALGKNPKWIKIENGVVTVDPKAISQDITIRAADPDDIVRGSISLHIKSSDALEGQEDGELDRLLTADNCEAPKANAELVESIDGTHAYKATAGYQTANISETASDIVVEMDIRFDAEGAGFQPAKSGKLNTCVVYHNGGLCVQTGGSAYTTLAGNISMDDWFHITLIRKKDAYAHIVFEKYDEDGNLTPVGTYKDVNQRNNEATAFVNINANTTYDNIRVLTPNPTDVTISTDAETVFAGRSIKASSAILWNGLEMKNPDASTFEYRIYDADDELMLTDGLVTVNGEGLINVDAMANAQDYHVRAVIKTSGKYASKKFTVTSSDIITINKLGANLDETRLVRLFVTKNFYYTDELTFLVKIVDERGNLVDIYTKQMYGDSLKTGNNTVSLDYDLPENFDKTKHTVKVYAFTKAYSDAETEADENMTVQTDTTSSRPSVSIANIPVFSPNATVLVMALKAGAKETNVKDEDILYFEQLKAADIAENTLIIPCAYEAGMTVKLSGNMNGVHTVVKAVGQ